MVAEWEPVYLIEPRGPVMDQENEKRFGEEQQIRGIVPTEGNGREEEMAAGKRGDQEATGWSRLAWIVIAVLTAIYIFIPEPTDAVPILGWLDEVTAFLIMTTALSKLGIKIPFLDKIFQGRFGVGEKDVTPRN